LNTIASGSYIPVGESLYQNFKNLLLFHFVRTLKHSV